MVTTSEAVRTLFPNANPIVDYRVVDRGSGQVISEWSVASLGPQPTQAALDAITQAQVNNAKRVRLNALAKQVHSDNESQNLALRATVKILVDEVNILRQWLTAFQSQTALATNLAALQTRVAALPSVPQRTYAQAKAAINNLIDAD